MKSNWKRTLLLYLILVSISNCSTGQKVLKTVQTPIESPVISSEAMQPATVPIPTGSLTSPFAPTLPVTEAEAKLLELLNDANCRLPCFLGIVPGETDESQAISVLNQLEEPPGTEIKFPKGDLTVSLDVITQNGYSQDHPEFVKWTEAKMSVYHELATSRQIDYQSPYYSEYFQRYSLSSLLSIYGIPEQAYVFLDTGIADMGLGIDLYLLHLDYSDQGWVAHLEMPLRTQDNLFLGCPSEAFTNLRLWSPDTPSRDYELDTNVLFTISRSRKRRTWLMLDHLSRTP